jgi:hypothetical protein
MERWQLQHRTFIVEQFFITNSVTQTQRNFRRRFLCKAVPSRNTILHYVQAFREQGSVGDKPRLGPCLKVRTDEKILIVRDALNKSPNKSLRRLSQQVEISISSVYRIVKRDLRLYPYKIQLVQTLMPNDYSERIQFSQWLLQSVSENSSFIENLFMSDEAHFTLSGCVNKQNCRFWASTNPHLLHESPLHSEKVTVWCAISAQHIIGPYFFENESGNAVTVNGDRYRTMLQSFFLPGLHLRNVRMRRTWFQQDGATCHTANETLALLQQHFPGRLISKRAHVNWPPRSPDLTPPDFFLWGFLKSRVYANNPQTLHDLRNNIREAVASIDSSKLKRVMQNVVIRAQECVARQGHHLEDVIFHT